MVLCKVNSHSLRSGRVQIAWKKPQVYWYFFCTEEQISWKVDDGKWKGHSLGKVWYIFCDCVLFFFFLLKGNFLEGWSVLVLLPALAGTTRTWERGEQSLQPCVWLVDAHLMLHIQGRNPAGSWSGPWAAESWQSREWVRGNASTAVFYPEGCAGTQYKQIQVLQREICASHKAGTQI